MVNFNLKDPEAFIAKKVVVRFSGIMEKHSTRLTIDEQDNIYTTLSACHLNGNPLDFQKMLECDEFTLVHDVLGIEQHINVETGKIERHFLPRCSLPSIIDEEGDAGKYHKTYY